MKLSFPNADAISSIRDPLDWTTEKNAIMVRACREMAVFHQERNRDIAYLYRNHGFDPRSIQTEADILRIPALGVTAMKHFLITSLPESEAVLKLTSSGTRGQKTQIWFDQDSFNRVQKMLDVCLEQEGLISNELTNYLIFNYDPDDAGDLGVAYTEKNQLRFAPVNHAYYAIRKNKIGEWVFDKTKAYEVLKKYAVEDKPVRIFGMPAFIFEFLNYLKENAPQRPNAYSQDLRGDRPPQRFNFKKGSFMLTGGGWKAAEDKKVTRGAFREMCFEAFGIASEMQRDAYGMAEHCAPYFECHEHQFHVAVFNRIIIRDPITMAVVPDGIIGLMELVTPFNAMMPTLAILSTDYGMLGAAPCKCGQKSPTFSLHGRAGISKHKGCAITASEIVKRTSGPIRSSL